MLTRLHTNRHTPELQGRNMHAHVAANSFHRHWSWCDVPSVGVDDRNTFLNLLQSFRKVNTQMSHQSSWLQQFSGGVRRWSAVPPSSDIHWDIPASTCLHCTLLFAVFQHAATIKVINPALSSHTGRGHRHVQEPHKHTPTCLRRAAAFNEWFKYNGNSRGLWEKGLNWVFIKRLADHIKPSTVKLLSSALSTVTVEYS